MELAIDCFCHRVLVPLPKLGAPFNVVMRKVTVPDGRPTMAILKSR
jgi:hypothetical protein